MMRIEHDTDTTGLMATIARLGDEADQMTEVARVVGELLNIEVHLRRAAEIDRDTARSEVAALHDRYGLESTW